MKTPRCAPLFHRCLLLLLGILQITALLIAFERPARAYIDPGSGFVFLQVAGSMVAGAAYYLRHRLRRMFGLVRRSTEVSSTPGHSAEVAENQP